MYLKQNLDIICNTILKCGSRFDTNPTCINTDIIINAYKWEKFTHRDLE